MRQGLTIAGLVLTLFALAPFAAAEDIPIWQQEAEQEYQPPPPRPMNNYYNPAEDMAPPMQQPPQDARPPYQERPRPVEVERRRPTYNTTNEPTPTVPSEPQPDFIAPRLNVDPDSEENSIDPEVTEGSEEKPAENGEVVELPQEQETPKWVEKSKGSFKVLNKVYTRNKEVSVKKGEIAKHGALNLKLEKCFRMPESDKKESSALLLISETFTSQPTKEIFHGWMFSSSPAISALEHPLYDVILLGCEDEEKKPSETKTEGKPADKKDAKNAKKDETKKSKKPEEKPKPAN